MGFNNNSWDYKAGYQDGLKWGRYDYSRRPGPEYDAGFMAGYFEKYGYTFDGQTYTQMEAERQAQKAQQNQQIQAYNQQFHKQGLPTFDLNGGSLLENLIKIIIQIFKSILGLLFRSDCQNAHAIFGSVNNTTMEALKIVKALVFVGVIILITSIHSLFDGDKTNKTASNPYKNPQQQVANDYNKTNSESVKPVKVQFGDNNKTHTIDEVLIQSQAANKKNIEKTNNVSNSKSTKTPNTVQQQKSSSVNSIQEQKATPAQEQVASLETRLRIYMQDLDKELKRNWTNLYSTGNEITKVSFRIGKNGWLLDYKITQSSGNPQYDKYAVYAVLNSSPFKPLPVDLDKEYIDVEFTFETSKRQ